jgi:hypothetical protein
VILKTTPTPTPQKYTSNTKIKVHTHIRENTDIRMEGDWRTKTMYM